ncbi:hypothetical protein PYCC9005_005818 [Savitreella phatthalungensis]
MSLRIGVDVGGTNTDAVLLDAAQKDSNSRGVLASYKHATTADVTDGIERAIRSVIASSAINPAQISAITIGTTHFINAVLERDRSRLRPVAVIRLSAHFTRSTPPFSNFPAALRDIMCGYYTYCKGGCNIDGSQIAPIDENEIRERAREIRARGLRTVVVTGVYSPIDETFKQEERCAAILRDEIPGVNVVCSRDIVNVGLLERENASILNASILEFARATIASFRRVLTRLQLGGCALLLTQNDGTIVSASDAARTPIKTFSSGATNSMRGAAYLAGISPEQQRGGTIVVDIGGTTSDAGMLLPSGFPRQAAAYVDVAGVRLNFSMPDLHSIPLGGGSIVRHLSDGTVTVGPDSVGYKLTSEALIFGGKTLTTSDVTVRGSCGKVDMGDASLVQSLPEVLVQDAQERITSMLADVVDQMKVSPEDVPVMLVGGGSVIAPTHIPGASAVVRPPFHDVANAVGAAIAKISGTIDVIENVNGRSVDAVVATAKERAIERCIAAGADPQTVTLADVTTIPIQYVTNQLRVIVKCVGELDLARLGTADDSELEDDSPTDTASETPSKASALEADDSIIDLSTYKPYITADRQWILSETDLRFLCVGTYVLGCAGGGSPYPEFLQLRDMVRRGHKLRVAECESVKDDDVVLWGGHMGSPAVSVERLGGEEVVDAMRELLDLQRVPHVCPPNDSTPKPTNKPGYAAVMSLEIGGGNGLQPLIVGSSRFFDTPTLDCDWMGRAYPTYYQTTLSAYAPGLLVPAAIASGDGKTVVMTRAPDDTCVDVCLRAACTEMGSRVGMAAAPTTGDLVKKYSVRNTVSLAWRIGRTILSCQQNAQTSRVADALIDALGGPTTAKKLFTGKIVRVESRLFKGHSYGSIVIEPLSNAENDHVLPDLPLAAVTAAASGRTGARSTTTTDASSVTGSDGYDSDARPSTASSTSTISSRHSAGTRTPPAPTADSEGSYYSPLRSTGVVRIPYKNENILCEHFGSLEAMDAAGDDAVGDILCSVPDLICVLDGRSGESLGVPEFRYGLKVVVLGITGSPLWSATDEGLALGGPAAFGYGPDQQPPRQVNHHPLGKYIEPSSVIAEYASHK